MVGWEALFGNNPDKDFELEMELWEEGELRAMIRNTSDGLELRMFAHTGDVTIPVSWLLDKLMLAQQDLKPEDD